MTDATAKGPKDETAEADTGGRKPHSRRWGPPTRIAVASLALIAMMFLFVFPTRSYLAQQRQVSHARQAVDVLKAQNEVLTREEHQLRTKSEIERLAREQFNMVLPGEQAYNVVPEPAESSVATTTTTVPATTTTTVP